MEYSYIYINTDSVDYYFGFAQKQVNILFCVEVLSQIGYRLDKFRSVDFIKGSIEIKKDNKYLFVLA